VLLLPPPGRHFYDAHRAIRSYGGRFVPETLMYALEELEGACSTIIPSEGFRTEIEYYLKEYAGRPTPLTFCRNISRDLSCRVYLKREDLLHSGAHKLNNALGQALLARHMGRAGSLPRQVQASTVWRPR